MGKSMQPQLLFLISRCIAFLVLGSALGLVGGIFSFSPTFTTILVLIVSLFMVAIGLQMLGVGHINTFPRIPKFAQLLKNTEKSHNKLSPVFLGILTFFLPCGITIVAQAQALTLGNPLTAGISMLAFSLGTLPPLLLIGTLSTKLYTNKRYSSFFSHFAGFVAILFGIFSINSQLNLLGLPSFNDLSHVLLDGSSEKQVAIVENKQLMQMEAKGFEYVPKEFTLKLNVPVRWEIYNSGAIGCANAVYAPGLYEEVILLKPGLNTFEFTPTNAGVYKISCSMGMVPPVYVTVK
jgi:sulfite exporter TauE/SafE